MHEKTPAEKIAAQQYLSSCAQRAESYLQEIYQQSPFEIAHAGWGEWYERMEYAVVGL
ncbi:MAG: hypothetical protein H6765_00115 [Candidatus Peribacteria bacterium]|nr:MAG: hypothetical protein H6765_00115 [Candidatus Peribacteria bacterium]